MEQLAIDFTRRRARRNDPDTSKDAAARAQAFAESHHGRILAALNEPGTCKEIGARIGLDHVAVARRLPELQAMGKAEPTDERRGGCRVWRRTI